VEKKNGEEGMKRCERESFFFMIIIFIRIAMIESYI
jgi:hypothetical protein